MKYQRWRHWCILNYPLKKEEKIRNSGLLGWSLYHLEHGQWIEWIILIKPVKFFTSFRRLHFFSLDNFINLIWEISSPLTFQLVILTAKLFLGFIGIKTLPESLLEVTACVHLSHSHYFDLKKENLWKGSLLQNKNGSCVTWVSFCGL